MRIRAHESAGLLLLIALIPLISCTGTDGIAGPSDSGAAAPGGSGPSTATTSSLTLSWDAPTTNEDGSPLDDLAGYNLYYGQSSPLTAANSQVIQLATVTTATIPDLTPGTWFVAVAARDASGNVSELSAQLSAVVIP